MKTEDGYTFKWLGHRDRWQVLKKRAAAGEISELMYHRLKFTLTMPHKITGAESEVEIFIPDFTYVEQSIQVAELVRPYALRDGDGRRLHYELVRRMLIAQFSVEVREVVIRR